jgi:ubiquitin carboxyl-terminal hydrolase L5
MTQGGSDDSCATLAIMNVLLNCEDVELGSLLEGFKDFTKDFDPVVISALYSSFS